MIHFLIIAFLLNSRFCSPGRSQVQTPCSEEARRFRSLARAFAMIRNSFSVALFEVFVAAGVTRRRLGQCRAATAVAHGGP
jgi:hypothetical protein